MKPGKQILWLMLLGITAAFWNCTRESDQITLSETSISVGADHTIVSVVVKSSVQFKVRSDAEWVSCSDRAYNAGSHEIEIPVSANTTSAKRQANVQFYPVSGYGAKTLVIEQEGSGVSFGISISECDLEFDRASSTKMVTVSSVLDLNITVDKDWIEPGTASIEKGSQRSLSITVKENPGTEARTGRVKLASAGDVDVAYIVVTQYAAADAGSKTLLTFAFRRSLNTGSIAEDCEMAIGNDNVVSGRIKSLEENPRELTATFTTDGDKVYVGEIEQISGVSKNDFSKPVTYKIVADDGSVNEYIVRLTRFTALPVLYITTTSGQPVQRRSVWETATLKLEGGLDFDDMELQDIEIKGRGNSTWTEMQRKPSYNIRLGKRKEVLGMPGHKRWSLLANYRDKTLLRNAVSYFIGYQCPGLEWTSKYRDVEMVFNGEFAGVYQLTEQIRIDANRVDIDELRPDDTDPAVITGGYLIEVDQYAVEYDENYYFQTAYVKRKWDPSSVQVIQKTPDKEDSNPVQAAYLQSYFMEVEKALYDAYSDRSALREQKFAEAFEKYLDLPSIIDQWFVYEISGTDEPGNPNSYHMYKKRGNDKLYGGPVWDFDYHSYMPSVSNEWRNRDAFWFVWLFDSATFRNIVKQRWNLMYPGLEARLLKFVDEQAACLDLSMQANWTLHEQYLVNEWFNDVNGDEKLNYKTAVARLRSYIPARLSWLNTNINGL